MSDEGSLQIGPGEEQHREGNAITNMRNTAYVPHLLFSNLLESFNTRKIAHNPP
jgi:hypothetical protein